MDYIGLPRCADCGLSVADPASHICGAGKKPHSTRGNSPRRPQPGIGNVALTTASGGVAPTRTPAINKNCAAASETGQPQLPLPVPLPSAFKRHHAYRRVGGPDNGLKPTTGEALQENYPSFGDVLARGTHKTSNITATGSRGRGKHPPRIMPINGFYYASNATPKALEIETQSNGTNMAESNLSHDYRERQHQQRHQIFRDGMPQRQDSQRGHSNKLGEWRSHRRCQPLLPPESSQEGERPTDIQPSSIRDAGPPFRPLHADPPAQLPGASRQKRSPPPADSTTSLRGGRRNGARPIDAAGRFFRNGIPNSNLSQGDARTTSEPKHDQKPEKSLRAAESHRPDPNPKYEPPETGAPPRPRRPPDGWNPNSFSSPPTSPIGSGAHALLAEARAEEDGKETTGTPCEKGGLRKNALWKLDEQALHKSRWRCCVCHVRLDSERYPSDEDGKLYCVQHCMSARYRTQTGEVDGTGPHTRTGLKRQAGNHSRPGKTAMEDPKSLAVKIEAAEKARTRKEESKGSNAVNAPVFKRGLLSGGSVRTLISRTSPHRTPVQATASQPGSSTSPGDVRRHVRISELSDEDLRRHHPDKMTPWSSIADSADLSHEQLSLRRRSSLPDLSNPVNSESAVPRPDSPMNRRRGSPGYVEIDATLSQAATLMSSLTDDGDLTSRKTFQIADSTLLPEIPDWRLSDVLPAGFGQPEDYKYVELSPKNTRIHQTREMGLDLSGSGEEIPLSPLRCVPEPRDESREYPGSYGNPDNEESPGRKIASGTKAGNTAASLQVCPRCQAPIDPNGKYMFALDNRWHNACMTCEICHEEFPSMEFYVLDNKPYCAKHYHSLSGTLCGVCEEGIEGECVLFDDDVKYHPRCFRCCRCELPLTDVYYLIDNNLYCETDRDESKLKGVRRRTTYAKNAHDVGCFGSVL